MSMQRALIIAFFMNLGLNPLLIFGIPNFWLGFGFDGIAYSTILSQYFVLAFMLYQVVKSKVNFKNNYESYFQS